MARVLFRGFPKRQYDISLMGGRVNGNHPVGYRLAGDGLEQPKHRRIYVRLLAVGQDVLPVGESTFV